MRSTMKMVRVTWPGRRFLSSLVLVTLLCACGDEGPTEPPDPEPSLGFISISAGQNHVCALETHGYAFCWGDNSFGQLGDGTTADRLQPTLVPGGLRFQSIGAAYAHTCGLTMDNEVLCWGDNRTGQFGDGTTSGQSTPRPVPGGRRFISLAVGSHHVCAVTSAGETYCWGASGLGLDKGALGGPAPESCVGYYGGEWTCSTTPVHVAGHHSFESVTAGVFYACGLTRTEEAHCWGQNTLYELGDGGDTSTSQPSAVAGELRFQMIEAGGAHACGIQDGAGYCWGGRLDFGQLGNGTFSGGSATPSRVVGDITFRALASRGNTILAHTCGITTDATAYCWGFNNMGQLGTTADDVCNVNSNANPCAATPLPVDGGLQFQEISAGAEFTCAITTSRMVYCWGRNESGQLGNGTRDDVAAPVPVVIP